MSAETVKQKYAGADWLVKDLKYSHPAVSVSELGQKVADLLGELFYGLYHVDGRSLSRVDWENDRWIEIILYDNGAWGTFDFNYLTRFVLLCHVYGVKGAIKAASPHRLRLVFHRITSGFIRPQHPTIEEAIEEFNKFR